MESALLSRIYAGPRRASTPERMPLTYEQAFGAFARRACGIMAPEDFARRMIYFDGQTFEGFVSANLIELLDDDDQGEGVRVEPAKVAL